MPDMSNRPITKTEVFLTFFAYAAVIAVFFGA